MVLWLCESQTHVIYKCFLAFHNAHFHAILHDFVDLLKAKTMYFPMFLGWDKAKTMRIAHVFCSFDESQNHVIYNVF